MLYFHGIADSCRFLHDVPNQFNILASAYRIRQYSTIKKYLPHAKSLFLDSGMISAWKKGLVSWADKQGYVADLAREIRPNYCAHLDLPMEPRLLAKNGVTPMWALAKTIKNARKFVGENLGEKTTKVFVVQGYELEEYESCINAYRDMALMDIPDVWFGIGSVCMRSPRMGLYAVCDLIRRRIPDHHLHAFGVGRKAWVDELESIGIDSCDSACASIKVGFNRGLSRVEEHRNVHDRDRQFIEEHTRFENAIRTPSAQLRLPLE